jgi:hypothetical protein
MTDDRTMRLRLVRADDHTLRFTWPLAGEDTTLEIQVESTASTPA